MSSGNASSSARRSSVCYVTTVNCDGRFVGQAVYVVENDHAIHYAGINFREAQKVVKGSSQISVWMNDKWMGDVDYKGSWQFKTKYHPDSVA